MAITKEEMINSIYKRYGIRFPLITKEKVLLDVYAGKYHFLEVLNLAKRGKADKFDRTDMRSTPLNDLKRLAQKYSKVTLPPNLERKLVIDILLKKLDPKKMSEKELKIFGKSGRSVLTDSLSLYGGWIPKVRKKLEKDDVKRGKREVKRYKR